MLSFPPFSRSPVSVTMSLKRISPARIYAPLSELTNLTNAELTNVGWRLHEMRGAISACLA